MQKTIHYIGPYFYTSQTHRNLLFQPSGVAKMNYVIYCLEANGFNIEVFSTAPSRNSFFCHFPRITQRVNDQTHIIFQDSFSGPGIVFKTLSRFWSLFQLFYYLWRLKPDDNILIYHVYQYRLVINLISFLKKRRIFFEIEEIFNIVWRSPAKKQLTEIAYLRKASGYIFVNSIIPGICKLNHKPGITCYGDFRTKSHSAKVSDGNIHLVYSGLIGNEKGQIYQAIEIIKLLPANYIMHITGYGEDYHIRKFREVIQSINIERAREAVIYHGCLSENEFKELISHFHIGLAPSDLSEDESKFMFPSKVPIYLGLNLTVVASPLQCIIRSELNNVVISAKENTPESLVEAILSVKGEIGSHISVLNDLNQKFISGLNSLFIDEK